MAIATTEAEASDIRPSQESGTLGDLTFRSVVLGIAVVVFINLWVTYSETVVHASRLNLSFFQITLLFVFLLLVAVLNPLLKTFRPASALTAAELLVVVAIGMVGCVVPTSGVVGFMLGVISTPLYFATPENGWADFYQPNLDSWIVPTNRDALRVFTKGCRRGQRARGRRGCQPWCGGRVWWAPSLRRLHRPW